MSSAPPAPAERKKNYPYLDAPRLPEGPEVDPRTFLGSGGTPVELEIGPGRGGFLFERLAAEPDARLLGLEIRRKWATLVDRRIAALGFGARGRVVAEDARHALPRFPAACLSIVYVHFPDPWWKKRHHKRLVLNETLLAELTRVLVPAGQVFVQTDVEERAAGYEAMFANAERFVPFGPTARREENPFGARSPREHRAISDGLPVYRLHYRLR